MDSNSNTSSQRKRASRPSKGSSDPTVNITSPLIKESPEYTDVAALAISPMPEGRPNSAIIPVSECRRSSRKKIIKFDVRDLLNKNRKPHKIQIEARIDSNVPSTTKSSTTTAGDTVSNISGSNAGVLGDLSSKQKTFMEKSAIFRRFSISQEQVKPPPPPIPMPPTILSKVGDNKDGTGNAGSSGKRINRTHEYYSNVMLKPKQTTSLIVAQMESNVRSTGIKGKSFNKSVSEAKALDKDEVEVAPQQKRRGRPPKTRGQDGIFGAAANDENNTSAKGKAPSQKLTPEKAKNWKEYKACLAQQSTATSVDGVVAQQSTVSNDMELIAAKPEESIKTVQEELSLSNSSDNTKDCLGFSEMGLFESAQADCIEEIEITKLDLPVNDNPENDSPVPETFAMMSEQGKDRSQPENYQCPISSKKISKQDLSLDTSVIQINSGQEVVAMTDDSINKCLLEKKEVTSITSETTPKDVAIEEKSIILNRASSLSESENSDRSSVSALTLSNRILQKNDGKCSPKQITSESVPHDEDKKIPVTKRSKRLQRKNNPTGHTVSDLLDDSFDKIQSDKNENPSTSDDTSKQPDESYVPMHESIELTVVASIPEESSQSLIYSKVVNEEICPVVSTHDHNVSNMPENSNSNSLENKIKEPEDNSSVFDDLKIDTQPSEGSFDEKIDKKIAKDNLELDKSESNDSQKSSTPKTKDKIPTKQRKSLRNRRENNKLGVDKDLHKPLEETTKDEVITCKEGHQEILEEVPQTSVEQQLEDNGISNKKPEVTIREQVIDLNLEMVADCRSIDVDQSIDCEESVARLTTTVDDNLIKTQPNINQDTKSIANITDVDYKLDDGSEQEINSKSSIKKARHSAEKPTSAKRKSLRIQKDSSPEEDYKQIVLIEQPNTISPMEECSLQPSLILDDTIVVSKRKPRKSRFKNLHGPDTEFDLVLIGDNNTTVKDQLTSEECKTNESPIISTVKDQIITSKDCKTIDSPIISSVIEQLITSEECKTNESPIISTVKDQLITSEECKTNESPIISTVKSEELKTNESPIISTIKEQLKTSEELKTNESPIISTIKEQLATSEELKTNESPIIRTMKEQLTTSEELKTNESQIIEETNLENELKIDEANQIAHPTSLLEGNTTDKIKKYLAETDEGQITSLAESESVNVEDSNLVDGISPMSPENPPHILDIPSTSQKESANNYVIKNVSIETNTLLDILRTVQSNKEAAQQVEAQKTSDTTPEVHDVVIAEQAQSKKGIDSVIDIADAIEITVVTTEMHDSVNAQSVEVEINSDSVPELHDSLGETVASDELEPQNSKSCDSTVILPEPEDKSDTCQESQAKDIKLKKILFDNSSTSNSPKRSGSASPLTLKKSQNSPCRSDTSSPLTLKKVNISPSRSDTSSPSTFNKKAATRRYERRSRRGDEESTHKTLEETFAEIAALSSKAVLEMSNLETELIEGDSTAPDNNKEKEENVSTEERNEILDVGEAIVAPDVKPTSEVDVREEIIAFTTPTRKARQPKTRSGKVQSPITDSKPPEDISQETSKKREDLTTTSETIKTTSVENSDSTDIRSNELCISSRNDSNMSSIVIDIPLEDSSDHPQHPTNKVQDEIIVEPPTYSSSKDELSASVKSEAPQQTSGQILVDDNSEREITDTTKVEEESQTANEHTFKKRDSPLSKSETKGSNRKSSSKKAKNLENVESEKTEDRRSTVKTPTPPPKRGRKAKTAHLEQPTSSGNSGSAGKKKQSKDQQPAEGKKEDEQSPKIRNDFNIDVMSVCLPEKSQEDKIAKKKRQRKLKEAFEAALKESTTEVKDLETLTPVTTPSSSPTFGLSYLNKSPPPETESEMERKISIACETTVSVVTATLAEPEEDPDPLKDIEKFIEDGVNLLKKGYKIDEDSVDNVLPSKPKEEEQQETEIIPTIQHDLSSNKDTIFATFETPADTPLATPSVTPPPKSPESAAAFSEEQQSSGGVRRSHRIKLITPKALVGRGLVRDKERFSGKDDAETKRHYTLDDHRLDLAEVEAKNAKFLKEMEERLSNFHVIKENEYKCERVISKEARKMICDCFLTAEEEGRGELACGEDCLNRLLMIECGSECNVKDRCTNKRFQKYLCSPCRVFRTEKKGFGIMADIEILPGEFIMEYVGEVINSEEFERRRFAYSQEKNRHYYFMALRSDAIIDATIKGNISRFINHSCDPNAETQKWTVNGELRIGFFSRKSIMPGEEITFDYQYQRYGREAQRCYCESSNCRGWIGQEPNSDEGEQVDDEDESDDEEDEEEDTPNLLVEDDEDSDASVSDPEEVQKKLEMAAAQAEAELLAPVTLSLDEKTTSKEQEEKVKDNEHEECIKPGTEEDSKSKFKKLLSKMAEKVAAKQKQSKKEQKLQRKKKSKESSSELANKQRSLEDPDIVDEVEFLSRCGLKTQSDTLRLSRLMVRAKLVQTRLNLLEILRKGELPCRRLFLDYHGLRLVHGWMSEDAGNMQIRLALLQTLELLPIANKTVLTDSKVMQVVRSWCSSNAAITSPSEDSLSSNSNSQDGTLQATTTSENFPETSDCGELQKLALKLVTTWDGLPEIFRIPKKERIEQMKEHEREADRQYAETEGDRYSSDHYRTNRFGRRFNTTTNRFVKPHNSKQLQQQNNGNPMRTPNVMTPENTTQCLSKTQRREMFAAKVARDEAEKRMAEERREFETKCRFFGLDPKKTRPQDVPFCVNPATGQWYSVERKPINTPPSYAHVQVPVKPKTTNPVDYQLPAVCSTLPPQWKYAITPLGQIYYYHVQYRVPQWTPPTPAQLQLCEMIIDDVDSGNEHTPTTGPDSSDDDDDILIGMDTNQLKAYIDRKVENRRQKRYQRLVDQRAISPRREEDRIYNQLEVRKYKENKEKIRKRKEEIRRKRAEALRQTSLNMCTLGSLTDSIGSSVKSEADDGSGGVLPIQDYLLSSDEDVDIKVEVNSPLIDKIVEGDKIVDELDALTTKRQLKRPLPPHRDLSESSPSSSTSTSVAAANSFVSNERQEYKKRKMEKKDKRKPKEQDAKYRRTKEKFRCEIAGIIVHHLKPYRKDSCSVGRIKSNEDFNHLARKLTHFVMIKELKYCESVGQTLVVTESVKNKSREFIKKYMAKYGDLYVKPANDPEFKDIPFTL